MSSSNVTPFLALVFPGQGSQRPEMGLDFVQEFQEAREVFAIAQAALGLDFLELCQGKDGRINLTEFTQPAILVTEIAILAVLRKHYGVEAQWYGGHSLGEYTALVAAGALPLEVAVQVVHKRGKLMQEAVAPGVGKMVALIMDNLPLQDVKAEAEKHHVDLANVNSPTQAVLSGEANAVEAVISPFRPLEDQGLLRIVPLETSAPFHSRLMRGIEPKFENELQKIKKHFTPSKAACVTSNWTGTFHSGNLDDLIKALVKQVSSSVLWQDNMKALIPKGRILEVGPDRTLRTFFYKVGADIASVTTVKLLRRVFSDKKRSA